MLVSKFIARKVIKLALQGEPIKSNVIMKALDSLGDGDGNVEWSDLVTALQDYASDLGDVLTNILDALSCIFDV